MKRRNRFTIPSKYVLFALTLLCVGTMSVSFLTDFDGGILNTVSGYVLIPVQKGINAAGGWARSRVDNLADLQQINEENQSLKEQVAELTLENNMLMQERYELQELRDLYNLDSDYSDLNKIAANVIGKDTGNWFNMFIIDKGSSDGIKVDMNVIAGGGLVGIVTKTGPDWAQVRSIIDDMSNVSAMILKNSDLCYVRGDLEMMSEGTLQLNQLRDQNDEVESGDKVVTSYASAKYHKGILIGYVNELAVDSNNLTKSGSITPAVDFEHLSTVLVITDLKQQVDESQADATEEDALLDETTEAEEDTSADAAEDPATDATSTEPTADGTPADQTTTE